MSKYNFLVSSIYKMEKVTDTLSEAREFAKDLPVDSAWKIYRNDELMTLVDGHNLHHFSK